MVTSTDGDVVDDHPVAVGVEDEGYHRTIRGKASVADRRDRFACTSDVTDRSMAAFASEGIERAVAPFEASKSAEPVG